MKKLTLITLLLLSSTSLIAEDYSAAYLPSSNTVGKSTAITASSDTNTRWEALTLEKKFEKHAESIHEKMNAEIVLLIAKKIKEALNTFSL